MGLILVMIRVSVIGGEVWTIGCESPIVCIVGGSRTCFCPIGFDGIFESSRISFFCIGLANDLVEG